jgi:hypothetical protein
MTKNIIYSTIVALVVSLVVGWFVLSNKPNESPIRLSGLTHFSGLSVGASGFEVTDSGTTALGGTVTTAGKLTTNAGQLRSYTSATTTGTAVTLKVSDILNYDTILVTPIVGATTLTFPASSTLSTLVPTAGDMQETCIYNATGTAAATITFVAGTGMNWQTVATSTGSVQVPPAIAAGGSGCFKFVRQAATAAKFDINALYTPYVNAD